MKNLYESLLDDFEKLEDSTDPINEVKQFLKDNYLKSNKLKISETPNKDGRYEVDCRDRAYVEVKNNKIISLTNGMFEFTNVRNFNCEDCNNLTSLEGAPKEVAGNFYCSFCNGLTSLEGAPIKVGGKFDCNDCTNLTSLKGAPKEVIENFRCSYCDNLTSLEGAPIKVGTIFDCSYCNNLTSLKGAPKNVNNFNCSYCKNLTSLEGAPKKVRGYFNCSRCATTFTPRDVKDVCNVKGHIYT